MAEAGATVYVYGIVPASASGSVAVPGVDGADVRLVGAGRLAAIVSDLGADAIAAAREVRRHWRVLDAVTQQGATVLPVRFGTVMESDQAVCDQLLAPQEGRLAALLEWLDGRVQLSVKGAYDEERELRDIVGSVPSIARLSERVREMPDAAGYYDRITLGQMISGEIERRRERDAGRALALLEPLAVAARAEPPAGEYGAFDLAFLVERERVDEFGGGVRRVADDLGERVAIRFVGPLPPFSFTDAELAEGSPAWA